MPPKESLRQKQKQTVIINVGDVVKKKKKRKRRTKKSTGAPSRPPLDPFAYAAQQTILASQLTVPGFVNPNSTRPPPPPEPPQNPLLPESRALMVRQQSTQSSQSEDTIPGTIVSPPAGSFNFGGGTTFTPAPKPSPPMSPPPPLPDPTADPLSNRLRHSFAPPDTWTSGPKRPKSNIEPKATGEGDSAPLRDAAPHYLSQENTASNKTADLMASAELARAKSDDNKEQIKKAQDERMESLKKNQEEQEASIEKARIAREAAEAAATQAEADRVRAAEEAATQENADRVRKAELDKTEKARQRFLAKKQALEEKRREEQAAKDAEEDAANEKAIADAAEKLEQKRRTMEAQTEVDKEKAKRKRRTKAEMEEARQLKSEEVGVMFQEQGLGKGTENLFLNKEAPIQGGGGGIAPPNSYVASPRELKPIIRGTSMDRVLGKSPPKAVPRSKSPVRDRRAAESLDLSDLTEGDQIRIKVKRPPPPKKGKAGGPPPLPPPPTNIYMAPKVAPQNTGALSLDEVVGGFAADEQQLSPGGLSSWGVKRDTGSNL